MARSIIKKNLTVRNGSGTTNAQGALDLSIVSTNETIVFVHILSGDANAMAIPFKYANASGYWYAKVLRWDNMATLGGKTFTYEVGVI